MADDDLLERQQALKSRVEATRADAAQLRQQLGEAFPKGATELGITRDRAERAKLSADHAVKDADARVTTLTESTAATRADLAKNEEAIEAAVANGHGDDANTQELRERADGYRQMIREGDARVHAAKLDAAAAREAAGRAERVAMEADIAYDEHYDKVSAAEHQIDLIEQRADLLEQARMKLVEAEVMYGEPPADADMDTWVGEKATLEVAADDLVHRADAITVDRGVIAVVIPTADDAPATDGLPTNDTDLMNPSDDTTDGASMPDVGGDALGLDLLDDDATDDRENPTSDDGTAFNSTGLDDSQAPEAADFVTEASQELADPQSNMWEPTGDGGTWTDDTLDDDPLGTGEPQDEMPVDDTGDIGDGGEFGADGF